MEALIVDLLSDDHSAVRRILKSGRSVKISAGQVAETGQMVIVFDYTLAHDEMLQFGLARALRAHPALVWKGGGEVQMYSDGGLSIHGWSETLGDCLNEAAEEVAIRALTEIMQG